VFEQTCIDEIGQCSFHVFAGSKKVTRDLADIDLSLIEKNGRHLVSAGSVLTIVNTIMAEPCIAFPVNGIFNAAFAITELKSGRDLIAKPDKQIHIGVREPAALQLG